MFLVDTRKVNTEMKMENMPSGMNRNHFEGNIFIPSTRQKFLDISDVEHSLLGP